MKRKEVEQTLILIKPDALKNSLTGYVLSQLSEFHTGLRFAAAKIVHVGRMLAEEHYAEHRGKVFYPSLIEYIMGLLHYPDEPSKRRVIALVYQGSDAVKKIRDICGPTNPHVAREKKSRDASAPWERLSLLRTVPGRMLAKEWTISSMPQLPKTRLKGR